MPSSDVKIKIIHRRKGLSGVTIIAQHNTTKEVKDATTTADGTCVLEQIKHGIVVIRAQTPLGIKNFRKNRDVPPNNHEFVVLDMGDDCYNLFRRVKRAISSGKFDKARQLIKSVKDTYDDFNEEPRLKKITDLEVLLPAVIEH